MFARWPVQVGDRVEVVTRQRGRWIAGKVVAIGRRWIKVEHSRVIDNFDRETYALQPPGGFTSQGRMRTGAQAADEFARAEAIEDLRVRGIDINHGPGTGPEWTTASLQALAATAATMKLEDY
jgi:hypothetical protein